MMTNLTLLTREYRTLVVRHENQVWQRDVTLFWGVFPRLGVAMLAAWAEGHVGD